MARLREIVNAKKSGTFSYMPRESGKTEYAKKHPKAYKNYEKAVDTFANAVKSAKSEALKKKVAGRMRKPKNSIHKTMAQDKAYDLIFEKRRKELGKENIWDSN